MPTSKSRAKKSGRKKAETVAKPGEGLSDPTRSRRDEQPDDGKTAPQQVAARAIADADPELGAQPASAPLPSAFSTARFIDDISRIRYPEGISGPCPELNANIKDGKFRYDRDFLLQFMSICKEKPEGLSLIDAISLKPVDPTSPVMRRPSSGRHRQAFGPSDPSRLGLGINATSGFGGSSGLTFTGEEMASFQKAPKFTNEERFKLSASRSASVGEPTGMPFGRPVALKGTPNRGGPGGLSSNRTHSQRSKQRDSVKMVAPQIAVAQVAAPANLKPVVPLKLSENRWDRRVIQVNDDSPEAVDRKVRGLLNKLTMERFDSISDQIIQWANKSEKEKDARTLIQVIRLVYEKAVDEAAWSDMYAKLCQKMMRRISNKVQDGGIKNPEGKPIAGGQLFKKYLLSRCQEDFERGWVAKETTAASAATKTMEDEAMKAANKEGEDQEIALYSDEYYTVQKAKRQDLGLIKFIGELFKLQMLTERIMHECVRKLLVNVNNLEEEEIESLCELLTTVGPLLDTPKARAHMDVYFRRMRKLTETPNASPCSRSILQDVIELRDRRWTMKTPVASESTEITQIHEAVCPIPPKAERVRRGLSFYPRVQPIKAENQQLSEDEEVQTPTPVAEMNEKAAEKKIKKDLEEFFAVRNLDEAEVYFTALPAAHHSKLVNKSVSNAVESKEADAKLVADLFARVVSKNLCPQDTLEQGFVPCAKMIDDIVIDAPKAFQLFTIMVSGAELDEERRSRLASKSMNSNKLFTLLQAAFDHPQLRKLSPLSQTKPIEADTYEPQESNKTEEASAPALAEEPSQRAEINEEIVNLL